MGVFAAGQVVLIPFPYSDLSRQKVRPALLLADAGRGDWVVCQITSNPYGDAAAIPLPIESFITGGLHHLSYLRPGKLFTAEASLILQILGTLNPKTAEAARQASMTVIRGFSIQ